MSCQSGASTYESISEPLGQYSNVLYDPAFVDAGTGSRVWSEIKATTEADAVAISHFPETGFVADVIGDEGMEEATRYVSSILDFREIESWESYFASLSKNQRKERNRKAKKLKAQGELEFEVHFYQSAEFAELTEAAVRLKRIWLRETDRHSQALFDEESMRFLSSLGQYLPQFQPLEGPVVHVLKLDGKPIAIEIGMLRKRHYYSYLGAIDLQWAQYAPGTVQIEMSQKWALENGVEKFDFLSDPSEYKKSWTNSIVPVKTRYIPVSAQGYFYCSVWKAQLKPVLRNIYQRSNPNIRRQIHKLLRLDQPTGAQEEKPVSHG